MLIGLIGKKRSGKDTVADYLVKNYDFIKYSLADPMKRACKDIFLLSNKQLWGKEKDEIDDRYGITPRKLLQVFGTELFQYDIYNHIPELVKTIPPRKLWIYRFIQWYTEPIPDEIDDIKYLKFNVVISDVRFKHEAEEIKKLGGKLIRIHRNLGDSHELHASETEMDDIEVDKEIYNFGTIKDLYKKIDEIMGEETLWHICTDL